MFSAKGGFNYLEGGGPTPDPYFNNVVLLLKNTDAAGVSNNKMSIDSGPNNLTMEYGTANLLRFTKDAPFTGVLCSMYNQSSTGAGVKFPTFTDLNFSGDFTIEGWFKVPTYQLPSAYAGLFTSTGNFAMMSRNASANPPKWAVQGYGTPLMAAVTSPISSNNNTWTFIALVRSGTDVGNIRLYVNGTLSASSTTAVTGSITYSGSNLGCGAGTTSPGAGDNQFLGSISNVRYSNIARYTSNFSRPTSMLTSDSNTVALINGDCAAFLSYSSNKDNTNILQTGSLIGVSGNQKFAGYNSISNVGVNGNYLQFPRLTITQAGGTAFTWECWVNASFQGGTATVYNSTNLAVYSSTNTVVSRFSVKLGTITYDTGITSTDGWHFIAIVRETSNVVKVYVDGVAVITQTITTSMTIGTPSILGTSTTSTGFNGDIFDLRITSGVARYTSNFTPPTEPFPTF